MATKPSPMRVTEHDVADAACKVLCTRPNGEGSMQVLKKEIPNHLSLSAADTRISTTRPREEMWEQQIRNITSHHKSPGNFIYEGFLERIKGGLKLTKTGFARLKHKGFI